MSKKTTRKVMLRDRDVGAKKVKEIKGGPTMVSVVYLGTGECDRPAQLNFKQK